MPITFTNTSGTGNFTLVNNSNSGQFSMSVSSISPTTTTTTTSTTSTTTTLNCELQLAIDLYGGINTSAACANTSSKSADAYACVPFGGNMYNIGTPWFQEVGLINPYPTGSYAIHNETLSNNNTWIIIGSGSTVQATGSCVPVSGSVFTQLNTIMPYLRANSGSLRNPNFFTYFLDGNAYSITDGGNDMYDNGNFTAPWLRNNTSYLNSTTIPTPSIALNYSSQSVTLTDTNFYYTSFGYSQSTGSFPSGTQNGRFHPLTIIGARSGSGPIGFQKAGNIGADGGGSLVTASIYSGSVVNGFTTYAFYRQTFGQSADPAVCDVYVLLGHPYWGSTFGTVVSSSNSNTDLNGGTLYATGSSSEILAMTTLLSRTGSIAITFNEIKTVVDNYITLVKTSLNY